MARYNSLADILHNYGSSISNKNESRVMDAFNTDLSGSIDAFIKYGAI